MESVCLNLLDNARKAVEAGYDIHHSAEILQEFYLRRYAEVTR